MRKLLTALIISLPLLFPVNSVSAEQTMPIEIKCNKIGINPITYICQTTNLYRYKFRPLWIIKDYKGRIVDTTYGWNSVEIFPQSGPFKIEVYRCDGTSTRELLAEGEIK